MFIIRSGKKINIITTPVSLSWWNTRKRARSSFRNEFIESKFDGYSMNGNLYWILRG